MNDSSERSNPSEKEEKGKAQKGKARCVLDEAIELGILKESERNLVTHLMGPGEFVEAYPIRIDKLYSLDILYWFVEGTEAQVWSHHDPSQVMELRAPETTVTLVLDPTRKWTVRLPAKTALIPFVMTQCFINPEINEEAMKTFTAEEREQYKKFFPPGRKIVVEMFPNRYEE